MGRCCSSTPRTTSRRQSRPGCTRTSLTTDPDPDRTSSPNPDPERDPKQAKLHDDVARRGLSLVVLGEWHNPAVLRSVRFFDDNTHAWMEPITGGANLPALNELLGPLGVAFGSQVCHDERTLTLTLTTYDLPLSSSTTYYQGAARRAAPR